MLFDRLPQVAVVQVRVDLRGEDALVAEQLLHLPDAGPALEQVGGERVPEGVRRYLLLDAGPAGASRRIVKIMTRVRLLPRLFRKSVSSPARALRRTSR